MDTPQFVALLMVDVVDSTELVQRLGVEAAARLWSAHDRLARDLLVSWRGREIDKTDGFLLLFEGVDDAVGYALAYHRALARLPEPVRARAGIHAGAVLLRENQPQDVARGAKPLEVEGLAKPIVARLAAIAQGGQTLLSAEARAAWPTPNRGVRSHGHWRLKGVAEPAELFEVGDDACPFTPPVDVPKTYRVVRRDGVWMPVREMANNLPTPVTSFIGRQRELGEVTQRLAQTRLTTLLGTGGLGKTRLAIQTARSVLGDFSDGAWFVDLAPLSDPAHVPQAVASALRIKEEPGRTSIDALLQHLGPRELLLVLDNCEHVAQAAAELTRRLLESAADVRVLATSREPLHITGEVGYVLSPMELPDERGCGAAQLGASEAVRLFVERAQAVQPGFAIDATNAVTVVEICRRLDAIPLAIELAAARMRSLSIDQIAQRLNDRFRLLTGGDRTALARQQTLRALIDWSHDLLSAPERTLLRRLAVFAGGWTLEAAESVGADDSLAGDDVVDVLAQLVDRSLVSMASGGQRYRLLESVRAYAHERLEESGEGDAARVRHLDHYLALAQRAAPALWGAQQGTWVARLDEDRDNLFAAHRCCDRVPDGASKGLLLVSRLQLYWMPAGLIEAGYRLTVEALARRGAQATSEVRCGASYAACQLAYFMRRLDEALAHGVASLEIARALGLTHRAIDALLMMGYVADECGRAEDSLSHFEEALALARRTNDRARLSYTLNGLGGRHMNSDDDAAIPLFEESLQLAREVDDDESVAITALNLARCLINRCRREEAADHLSEALQTSQRIGATRAVTYAVDVCAMLAACSGDGAAAARLLGAAEAQWQRLGVTRPPAEAAQAERATIQAQAQLGASEFTSCHALGQALSLDDAAGDVQAWLVGRIGCAGARPAITRAG